MFVRMCEELVQMRKRGLHVMAGITTCDNVAPRCDIV